jgi:ABC-2 type transport system permease protein
MRGFGTLVVVQFKLYLREPSAFFFTLAFPSLLLILFGVIYGNDPLDYLGQVFGTVDASVPAYAGIVIGTVALISIPIDMATNRDNGVLRRYRATPLRPVTYLAAVISVYYAMMLVGMALLIVVGRLGFDLRIAGTWWEVTAGFTLSALAFIAIGFVLASLASTARVAQAVGMAFFFPMMFLSGAGLPLEILPSSIRGISNFLPLTYVVKLMQGLWFGEGWLASSVWAPALILLAILVVTVPIAVLTFRWE